MACNMRKQINDEVENIENSVALLNEAIESSQARWRAGAVMLPEELKRYEEAMIALNTALVHLETSLSLHTRMTHSRHWEVQVA